MTDLEKLEMIAEAMGTVVEGETYPHQIAPHVVRFREPSTMNYWAIDSHGVAVTGLLRKMKILHDNLSRAFSAIEVIEADEAMKNNPPSERNIQI